MENVERAPAPVVAGYAVTRLVLDNRWLGEEQQRERHFSFGCSHSARVLDVSPELVLFENPSRESAVVSTRGYQLVSGRGYMARPETAERRKAMARRPLTRLIELQGLPPGFLKDAPFTDQGKRRVLANGVPLPMGRAIARAVKRAMGYAIEAAA